MHEPETSDLELRRRRARTQVTQADAERALGRGEAGGTMHAERRAVAFVAAERQFDAPIRTSVSERLGAARDLNVRNGAAIFAARFDEHGEPGGAIERALGFSVGASDDTEYDAERADGFAHDDEPGHGA